MRRLLLSAVFVIAACGQSQTPGADNSPQTQPPSQTPAPQAAAPQNAGDEEAAELQQAVAALPAPYNGASYEAGRRVFNQCRSCHTIEEGGPDRVGPNLHGVIGRQVGAKPGFNYSPALRQAGFAWDPTRLDGYLANPRAYLPDNRMAFVGVRNDTQRRDLIAYIQIASRED